VRPGLLFKHNDKRSHTLDKRKAEKNSENEVRQPKKGRLEAERRQIGLQQPISQDNKGFALLQKMGYKPGLFYFCCKLLLNILIYDFNLTL